MVGHIVLVRTVYTLQAPVSPSSWKPVSEEPKKDDAEDDDEKAESSPPPPRPLHLLAVTGLGESVVFHDVLGSGLERAKELAGSGDFDVVNSGVPIDVDMG